MADPYQRSMLTCNREWGVRLNDGLTKPETDAIHAVQTVFPFKITREYASLIDWNDPGDPLRKQVVPDLKELRVIRGESPDPLQEQHYMPLPGIIHKYASRIVWLITANCPVHCRFCFRRWKVAESGINTVPGTGIERVMEYLQHNPSVFEVIFSGGDPFVMDRALLNRYLKHLDTCPTVSLVRFHTRAPVVAWDSELSREPLYKGAHYTTRIVLHINHINEISAGLLNWIRQIQKRHIPLLTQTVLLSGINDSENDLFHMFLALAKLGVQPYYLHYPDPASGTGHFRLSRTRARQLHRYLCSSLPGYAVPKLVCDIPGRAAKTML